MADSSYAAFLPVKILEGTSLEDLKLPVKEDEVFQC